MGVTTNDNVRVTDGGEDEDGEDGVSRGATATETGTGGGY